MTIKNYCKSIGFEIVGKLTRMSNLDRSCRCYLDEAMNEFLLDINSGNITIITAEGGVI